MTMNRAERRQHSDFLTALDESAAAWLEKRMQEPDAKDKTVQELVDEYWAQGKDQDINN